METVLNNDLSTITTVPVYVLNKLTEKGIWCICDSVEKSIYNKDEYSTVDIGYGKIMIKVCDNEIKYKFIPGDQLRDLISETVFEEKNPLKIEIEESLVNKITNQYKDLF